MNDVLVAQMVEAARVTLYGLAKNSEAHLAQDIEMLANEAAFLVFEKHAAVPIIEDPVRYACGVAKNLWRRRLKRATKTKEYLVEAEFLETAGPVKLRESDLETEKDFHRIVGGFNASLRNTAITRSLCGRGWFGAALTSDCLNISIAALEKRILRARQARMRVGNEAALEAICDVADLARSCQKQLSGISARWKDAPEDSPEGLATKIADLRCAHFAWIANGGVHELPRQEEVRIWSLLNVSPCQQGECLDVDPFSDRHDRTGIYPWKLAKPDETPVNERSKVLEQFMERIWKWYQTTLEQLRSTNCQAHDEIRSIHM